MGPSEGDLCVAQGCVWVRGGQLTPTLGGIGPLGKVPLLFQITPSKTNLALGSGQGYSFLTIP